jgi:hypothetical protein
MALIKCKECNKEISSSASKCPHCGVKRPGLAETLASVLAFGFIACIGAAWWAGSHGEAKKTETPREPAPTQAAQLPIESADDTPLTSHEAGRIFSTYVGQLQAKLFVMGSMSEMYVSRLKQDAAFYKLDDMRADSETLKNGLMKLGADLSQIPYGMVVEDADSEVWEKVLGAAQAMAADDVEMAVDLAVQANYGAEMNDDGDMDKLARDLRQQRKAFNAAVMDAYKHFGYKRGDIDKTTLTLNDPDRPSPSPAPVVPLANFSESFRPPPAATR